MGNQYTFKQWSALYTAKSQQEAVVVALPANPSKSPSKETIRKKILD
jgi:hypothetical protein